MSRRETKRPRWTEVTRNVGRKFLLKRGGRGHYGAASGGYLDGETSKVLIAEFTGEGRTVQAFQFFPSLRVLIAQADGDIDEDGANGQRGGPAGYMVGNKGREALANGGMGMRGGRVVGVTDWYDDIVILGPDYQPREFPGGIIASKTAYRYPGKKADDPAAYVDAETVPFMVVSPRIRNRAKGVVLGCAGRIRNRENDKAVITVTADIGPVNKIGELSPAAAREIDVPDNPRTGGTDKPILDYELFPGKPAVVRGEPFVLLPA